MSDTHIHPPSPGTPRTAPREATERDFRSPGAPARTRRRREGEGVAEGGTDG